MSLSRRQLLKGCGCTYATLSWPDVFAADLDRAAGAPALAIADPMAILPPGAVRLKGYLERFIQRSIAKWSKGALPYQAFADFFRNGRPTLMYQGKGYEFFAAGEMWGKAVRSAALFYRYTGDAALKAILKRTVADLLSTRRVNGSISCSPVEKQPEGPMGDIWERRYVLLGLDEYYQYVERDPRVLEAMIDAADATLAQVGPPPKTRIVDLGWSANHIESSAILEPVLRLYQHTGYERYLDFARYIVEVEGGAKAHPIFSEIHTLDPVEVGGIYPKACEMTDLFEGLAEYFRATAQEKWRETCLTFYRKILEKEITLIGNGGGDMPYHPNVMGEAWDNTALEQTHPDMKRMMETCTGVTWLRFCSQILRLTGDPHAVDAIERYAYNGLIGAMKPQGDGFSYVNLLNGVKTEVKGWGTTVENVYVTCCNLNGPIGLAYLPLIAVMSDAEGPVVNLYNEGTVTLAEGPARRTRLSIETHYPLDGVVRIRVSSRATRRFVIKLRIPGWSELTEVSVNGEPVSARAGTFVRIERRWVAGDLIELKLDMRCRLIRAPLGSSIGSDRFQALVRGPIVLARDESLDAQYDQPVDIVSKEGIVEVKPVTPARPHLTLQFLVPTRTGSITMVDYASVDSWSGKRVQTWLPIAAEQVG